MEKPKYSLKEVSQKFNLKKLLGYEPSEKQKELFYELAIDKMVDRTTSGVDIDGKKFKPYTEEYANFKGVTRTSVDLVLEGDMLNGFEESQVSKNVLKIKIADEETPKAYNHNVGDTLPKRTFFGFNSEKQLSDVVNFVDRIKEDKPRQESRLNLADLRAAITAIDLDFEGFDGEN